MKEFKRGEYLSRRAVPPGRSLPVQGLPRLTPSSNSPLRLPPQPYVTPWVPPKQDASQDPPEPRRGAYLPKILPHDPPQGDQASQPSQIASGLLCPLIGSDCVGIRCHFYHYDEKESRCSIPLLVPGMIKLQQTLNSTWEMLLSVLRERGP